MILFNFAQKKLQGVSSLKKIYFDVGEKDDFSLAEGAEKFHQILEKRKMKHEYKCIAMGKHDAAHIIQQFPSMITSLLSDG